VTDAAATTPADDVSLVARFELMCTMRAFEEACAQGIESGELRGELHLADGQEAVAAGMVGTLRDDDWVVSTHRSHLHAIAKGVPLEPLLAEVYERATGLCGGKGGHLHLFDLEHRFSNTGIVGSSLPVALGHAYASRLDGSAAIAVGVTGDGGANTGQFHETMNMAGAWKLPLVVLVENNAYAISVKAQEVTAGAGIAERAAAYGAWGRRVDGTDTEAVAVAFAEAAANARSGDGPAILEAVCHRFRGHYEGDFDHYRTSHEKEQMLDMGDPIGLTRSRLLERGVADETTLDAILEASREGIQRILQHVLDAPAPDPEAATTGVYSASAP
jgi:acetoin:2,6-dichlorophenolindophenol oxidoreductase subunit alpha